MEKTLIAMALVLSGCGAAPSSPHAMALYLNDPAPLTVEYDEHAGRGWVMTFDNRSTVDRITLLIQSSSFPGDPPDGIRIVVSMPPHGSDALATSDVPWSGVSYYDFGAGFRCLDAVGWAHSSAAGVEFGSECRGQQVTGLLTGSLVDELIR